MEELEQMVLAYYASPSESANQYFTQFQQSHEAWSGALELLGSQHPQVAHFGANILLQKCRGDVGQLDSGQADELVCSVLARGGMAEMGLAARKTLFAAAGAATVGLGKDSMGLSAQLTKDYIGALSPLSMCMYLGGVAAEFASKGTRMRGSEMGRCCMAVMPLLAQCVGAVTATEDLALFTALFNTLAAWGAVGLSLTNLLAIAALEALVNCLAMSELFQAAATAISECAENEIEDMGSIEALCGTLFPALAGLCQMYSSAAQADMTDWCQVFAVLVATVGRCLLCHVNDPTATPHASSVTVMLETMLACTANPAASIAELPFPLWNELATPDKNGNQFWSSVYVKVTQVVLERCAYAMSVSPEQNALALPGQDGRVARNFSQWSDSDDVDKDEFRSLRRNASVTLHAAAVVLTPRTLNVMISVLGDAPTWQMVEVVFFGATCIQSEACPRPRRGPLKVDPAVQDMLVNMFGLAYGQAMASRNRQLQATVFRFTTAYSHWLAESPKEIGVILPLVVENLSEADMLEVAADTFKTICSSCGQVIAGSTDVSALIASATARAFRTNMAGLIGEGLIRVIAHCPVPMLQTHVTEVLRPIAESIQALGARQPATAAASAALLSSLVDTLDTLAKTIRFLDAGSFPKQEDGIHIVLSVVAMFWDNIQAIQAAYGESDAVAMGLCGIYESIIHAGKKDSLSVVPNIFQAVFTMMAAHASDPYVYLPFKAALEYHGDNEAIFEHFASVLDMTFTCLQLGGPAPPDFVNGEMAYTSFLDLCFRTLIFSPQSLYRMQHVEGLLEFAVQCIACDARAPFMSACSLLSKCFEIRIPPACDWLTANAEALFPLLLTVIASTAPVDQLMRPAELFSTAATVVGVETAAGFLREPLRGGQVGENLDVARRSAHFDQLSTALSADKRATVKAFVEFGGECRL